jgi:hypothetical protein
MKLNGFEGSDSCVDEHSSAYRQVSVELPVVPLEYARCKPA